MVTTVTNLFATAQIALCAVIFGEAFVFRKLLRDVLSLKRFAFEFDPTIDSAIPKYSPGMRAPKFTLLLLGSNRKFESTSLRGRSHVLFFASLRRFSEPDHSVLATALSVKWRAMDGRVYVIWDGDEQSCRQFIGRYAAGFPEDHVLMDSSGLVSRRFRITDTPRAIELDGSGRLGRYGRPLDIEIEPSVLVNKTTTPRSAKVAWPDNLAISGAGFTRLSSETSCIITRFQLRSPVFLIPFYLAFKRVQRASRETQGLIVSVFLVENTRTCYTLSLWRNDLDIVNFGKIREHVRAANSAFGPTYRKELQRHEIWSAQFRLWATSAHNHNWDGVNLTEQPATSSHPPREEHLKNENHIA